MIINCLTTSMFVCLFVHLFVHYFVPSFCHLIVCSLDRWIGSTLILSCQSAHIGKSNGHCHPSISHHVDDSMLVLYICLLSLSLLREHKLGLKSMSHSSNDYIKDHRKMKGRFGGCFTKQSDLRLSYANQQRSCTKRNKSARKKVNVNNNSNNNNKTTTWQL